MTGTAGVPPPDSPFRRAGAGRIEVRLPDHIARVVAWAGDYVAAAGASPGSPGFARLFGALDDSATSDDPLVTLERQSGLADVSAVAARTWRARFLTDVQAEAWLKILGLALAVLAEELGIHTDEERAALAGADATLLETIQALQLCLMEALDGQAWA